MGSTQSFQINSDMSKNISRGVLFDSISFLKKECIYEYGLWNFVLLDNVFYATPANNVTIKTREYAGYDRHRLIICIVVGSYQGIMCIRNVDGVIGVTYACDNPELSGSIISFDKECKLFDEYLEIHKDDAKISLDNMDIDKQIYLPNSGKIFVRNEMTLTHENNGITIRNEKRFPIVFPKDNFPTICGKTINELINKWYDTPINPSYESQSVCDGGGFGLGAM